MPLSIGFPRPSVIRAASRAAACHLRVSELSFAVFMPLPHLLLKKAPHLTKIGAGRGYSEPRPCSRFDIAGYQRGWSTVVHGHVFHKCGQPSPIQGQANMKREYDVSKRKRGPIAAAIRRGSTMRFAITCPVPPSPQRALETLSGNFSGLARTIGNSPATFARPTR